MQLLKDLKKLIKNKKIKGAWLKLRSRKPRESRDTTGTRLISTRLVYFQLEETPSGPNAAQHTKQWVKLLIRCGYKLSDFT